MTSRKKIGLRTDTNFEHEVVGTWGEFTTPGGTVAYVMARARLGGDDATDNERRLTAQLLPVREVLDPATMDFNQLLQRDLDDHRVASELVPYLLRGGGKTPGFFPPIIGLVLPFVDGQPDERHSQGPQKFESGEYAGANFVGQRVGNFYAFQFLEDPDNPGEPSPALRVGRLRWSSASAKLVVIDGQHRAMALLAIERTRTKSWEQSRGKQFRHFYERLVELELKRLEKQRGTLDLGHVEVPVLVCWFKNIAGAGVSQHAAARALFVDVNKNARRPTMARLILLSDSDLCDMFARDLLSVIRSKDSDVPLAAVEYDNPEEGVRAVRWSAMCTLQALRKLVQHSVFAQAGLLDSAATRIAGKAAWELNDSRLVRELELDEVLTEEIVEGDRTFAREAITHDDFPMSRTTEIVGQFRKSWGAALLAVLTDLAPYRAHCEALVDLQAEWTPEDAPQTLAYDAIFGGSGLYWSLRDAARAWDEEAGRSKSLHRPDPVRAVEVLEKKSRRFAELRRGRLLDASVQIELCDLACEMYNTIACQLGAVLVVGMIAKLLKVSGSQIATVAADVVGACNAGLRGAGAAQLPRLLFVVRGESLPTDVPPFNRLDRLEVGAAAHFRYFWLEVLCTSSAQKAWMPRLKRKQRAVEKLRDEGRSWYLIEVAKNEMRQKSKVEGRELTTKEERDIDRDVRKRHDRALKAWLGR